MERWEDRRTTGRKKSQRGKRPGGGKRCNANNTIVEARVKKLGGKTRGKKNWTGNRRQKDKTQSKMKTVWDR